MELKEERAIFNIERKEAAAMIGVSMRTIDRYIRSGRLAHKKVGYNVFVARDELEKIINRRTHDFMSMDVGFDREEEEHQHQQNPEYTFENSDSTGAFEVLVYKSLYEGTKKELFDKQKEVEILNFRLGEVELKLRDSIPLLAFNENLEKSKEDMKQVENHLKMTRYELDVTSREHKKSIIEKHLYLGISVLFAFIILVLASALAF